MWTSLLAAATYPAAELARLYAQRWEHELYYRQIKLELRTSDLLQSHTPETAAQEIAAIEVCSAVLAHERARAARGAVPALSISFLKTLQLLRPLWLVLALGADLLSAPATGAVSNAACTCAGACARPNGAGAAARARCASPSRIGRACCSLIRRNARCSSASYPCAPHELPEGI